MGAPAPKPAPPARRIALVRIARPERHRTTSRHHFDPVFAPGDELPADLWEPRSYLRKGDGTPRDPDKVVPLHPDAAGLVEGTHYRTER
jgi:hypothetical protein